MKVDSFQSENEVISRPGSDATFIEACDFFRVFLSGVISIYSYLGQS